MAKMDQFLIAPIQEGLQKNVEPWLIPDEAFAMLQNAYVWRSRLRKRFGSRYIDSTSAVSGFESLQSRLRIKLGTTDGAGDIASGASPIPAGAVYKVGQMFSIGTELFTVVETGVPGTMITNSATATNMDYNTTTGAYDIQGSLAVTDCYWYPAESVMGFSQYEQAAVNDETTYAFDTRFAYFRSGGGWDQLSGGSDTWTGADYNFFWYENWRGINAYDRYLYVTNGTSTDNVRYWDGTTWAVLTPATTAAPAAINVVHGARLVIGFKDRLLLLNTYEKLGAGATNNFPWRIRYSQNGDPIFASDATSWLQYPSGVGKGGYFDLPTTEAIISARLLRDRLIVFCERSTWEIVFTGNKVAPFAPQRINSELGAESTFSTILFDKVLLGVGNVGIHACNGANVDRIDEKIPQEVFKFHNGNQGVDRVAGIRDYFTEMAYWTIPDETGDPTYPTRVLVYNYKNKTWALNDDSITAFGYLQNLDDTTWAQIDWTWEQWNDTWDTGARQSEYRNVIAGNQEGYTFLIDSDVSRNAGALQITNAYTGGGGLVEVIARDHNLKVGDFILIENAVGTGLVGLNGIHQIAALPTPTPPPVLTSADAISLVIPTFAGTYLGGGTITRVSQIDIKTKEYNFYAKEGADLFIPKISFYVDRTENGQMAVDYSTSSSDRSLVTDAELSGTLLGTSVLETTPYTLSTYEDSQTRFWHIIYPQAEGEVIQMRIYLDLPGLLQQLLDGDISQAKFKSIVTSDFTLNAISIYARAIRRY